MKTLWTAALLLMGGFLQATEYHVALNGNDTHAGTGANPFRTIDRAARIAKAGDTVTVHKGTYREWVNPQNGGTSPECRIVYRAAPGEKVEIKGSEPVGNWKREKNGVWKAVVPNSLFGTYHPYIDLVHGDWFNNHKRDHHTGEVFLNERSLYEVPSLDQVIHPQTIRSPRDPEGSTLVWYSEVGESTTTFYARFGECDPNKELVEISARRTCFYPDKPHVDYITLQGFHISQAASQWGAPTAEQIGMVATHWNKGWIIENNVIRNAKCSGITLGKNRSTGHNVWVGNPTKDGSLHYLEVTFNALREGWRRETVGSHIVRNNIISDCEQTGMCGSMGCSFSEVYGNHIYNIWVKRQFSGAEIGGIKFHAPIDTYIHHNRIHHTGRGIWLDWMTQGTRVSSNLMYGNDSEDLFVEVDHGPYMVDNNIFLSPCSVRDQTEGGAYVQNIIGGAIHPFSEFGRYTPYHLNHSTEVMGVAVIANGDHRFYNNLFVANAKKKDEDPSFGLAVYNGGKQPNFSANNLFTANTQREHDSDGQSVPAYRPSPVVEEQGGDVYLKLQVDLSALRGEGTQIVDARLLGKPRMTLLPFEFADGSPARFDRDYFGKPRGASPLIGPFENLTEGENRLKVW